MHISLTNKKDYIRQSEIHDFFQSKYEFYKSYTFWVVVFAAVTSSTYIISDIQIFGHFTTITLIPRMSIYLFLFIYILIYKRVSNYKVLSVSTYTMILLVEAFSNWAFHYLPDKSHVNEGLLIMQCMFFATSFGSPFSYGIIAYATFFGEIVFFAHINHYADYAYMISLGLPLAIGISCAQIFLQKLYVSHFKMEQHLKNSSFVDSLTGSYNRNYVSEYIEREKGEILPKPSSILIFDIDYFKNVNDNYGHDTGDKILKWVAELTQDNIRDSDYLIRWGGEEFVILMPNTSLEEAKVLAERLRMIIETTDNKICPVTISGGVGLFIDNDIPLSVSRADKALYTSKKKGRNQISCSL